jgi:hypothetical protein
MRRRSGRRTAARLTIVLVAGGASALGFAPTALAGTSTTLTPTTEAWYQPNPSCVGPAGCVTSGNLPVAPPAEVVTNPYPAGTLHVAMSLGQETARTYLGLSLFDLVGRGISAGTLTVPLDTAAADGSTTPEDAKVQVCVALADVAPREGSIDTPPAVDCTAHASVTYVATPEPRLQADLRPLLSRLPAATGLVLLPDASQAAPTDAWQVVFSAHDRSDAGKTPPATVALTFADAPELSPDDAPVVTLPDKDHPGLGGVAPVSDIGFAAAQPDTPPAVTTPGVAGPQTATGPTVAGPQSVAVDYKYPYAGAWLLPLGLLVIVPLAAQALTKDLTPTIAA